MLSTQEHIIALVQAAMSEAKITSKDIAGIAYTKVSSLKSLPHSNPPYKMFTLDQTLQGYLAANEIKNRPFLDTCLASYMPYKRFNILFSNSCKESQAVPFSFVLLQALKCFHLPAGSWDGRSTGFLCSGGKNASTDVESAHSGC